MSSTTGTGRKRLVVGRLMRVGLDLLALVLLLTSAALVALWVRGYYVGDTLHWVRVDERAMRVDGFTLQAGRGRAAVMELHIVAHQRHTFNDVMQIVGAVDRHETRPPRLQTWRKDGEPVPVLGVLGFRHVHDAARFSAMAFETRGMIFPLWPAVVLTGAWPVVRLWRLIRARRRARRRVARGLCRQCGYDLRASTGRCPECGEAVPLLTPSPSGRGLG
jgi:hypothetical protein